METKNKTTRQLFAVIGAFTLVGGIILLATSLASSGNVSVDLASIASDLRQISDPGAHNQDGVVFEEQSSGGPVGEVTPIPVPDPAEAAGVRTVDAGCSPSEDCMKKIKTAANGTKPVIVTFGSNHNAGTEFQFNSGWPIPSGVSIVGKTKNGSGRPVVKLSRAGIVFTIAGKSDLSFKNFDVDMNKCGTNSSTLFNLSGVVKNVHISDLRAFNGGSNSGNGASTCFFAQLKTSDGSGGLYISNAAVEEFKRGIFLHSASRGTFDGLYVQDSVFTEYYIGAIGFTGTSSVDNVYIEKNHFRYHSLKAHGTSANNEHDPKNSNPVKFIHSLEPGDEVHHKNVFVRYNKIEGRPGRTASDPGGSGDLLSIHGADNFVVEYNELLYGGEVGLTATAGLRNGSIRYNIVKDADFSGIQVGNATGKNSEVENVSVYGNDVQRVGGDVDGRPGQTKVPNPKPNGPFVLPGIAMYNVDKICTVNNFVRTPKDNGIWLFDGTKTTTKNIFKLVVGRVYVSKNNVSGSELGTEGSVKGVELNYTQSGNPNRDAANAYPKLMEFFAQGNDTGYYNGVYGQSSGQDPWEYGSNMSVTDRDNDGFHSECYGETNDNDPCVPDKTAAACRKP